MKIRSMLVALAFCLTTATAANAVVVFNATTVTTGNRPLNGLQVGDTITVNIRMANPTAVAIFGVGAGVQAWNQAVVSFASGQMNAGPYFCTAAACTAGLSNTLNFPQDEETGNYSAGPGDVQNVVGIGNYVPVIQAIATQGRAGDGTRDPGLDGVVNGGDAQVRLVFNAVAEGTTTINIGTNPNPVVGNVVVLAGGATAEATNAVLNITVPEPGTLAAGLGALVSVVAVAGIRRRFAA